MCDLESIMVMPKRVKFSELQVGDRVLRGRRNNLTYKTVAEIRSTNRVDRRLRPKRVIFTDGTDLCLWENTDMFITRIRGEVTESTFTTSMTTEVLPYLEYAYQALRCLQSLEVSAATDPKHVEDVRRLGCMIDRFKKRVDAEVNSVNAYKEVKGAK